MKIRIRRRSHDSLSPSTRTASMIARRRSALVSSDAHFRLRGMSREGSAAHAPTVSTCIQPLRRSAVPMKSAVTRRRKPRRWRPCLRASPSVPKWACRSVISSSPCRCVCMVGRASRMVTVRDPTLCQWVLTRRWASPDGVPPRWPSMSTTAVESMPGMRIASRFSSAMNSDGMARSCRPVNSKVRHGSRVRWDANRVRTRAMCRPTGSDARKRRL